MTVPPFRIEEFRRDPLTFHIAAKDDAYGKLPPFPEDPSVGSELTRAEMLLRYIEDGLLERHGEAVRHSAIGQWLADNEGLIDKTHMKVMKNRKAACRLVYEISFKNKPAALAFRQQVPALTGLAVKI